jgi:hypothetical protein
LLRKRKGQEIAENNDLSPDFCEPAQSQKLRLHNREKSLDEKNADTVSRGDSESASHPVTFADNGERNELRGLNKTGGRKASSNSCNERGHQLRRGLFAFRRVARDLGSNIARHAAKVSRQFFEEFALLRIGRELADQVAILGFDEQLFQFYPQQIIFHTSGLPHGIAAEGPKVNTSLEFKMGRPGERRHLPPARGD